MSTPSRMKTTASATFVRCAPHAFERLRDADEFEPVGNVRATFLQVFDERHDGRVHFRGDDGLTREHRAGLFDVAVFDGKERLGRHDEEMRMDREERVARREKLPFERRTHLAHAFGGVAHFVAHALEVDRHAQVPEQHPQVDRLGLTARENAFDESVEILFLTVDVDVRGFDFARFPAVELQKHETDGVELTTHRTPHFEHVVLEFVQFLAHERELAVIKPSHIIGRSDMHVVRIHVVRHHGSDGAGLEIFLDSRRERCSMFMKSMLPPTLSW